MIATLTKRAPAKVVPMDLRNRLRLNVCILMGRVPMTMTMRTKRMMNAIFRMASTPPYSMDIFKIELLRSDDVYNAAFRNDFVLL